MSERFSGLLPYLAVTAAAALVVVLAVQKRNLVSEVEMLRFRLQEAVTKPLPGQHLPSFQTTTLEGEPVTIGELPAEGRQVLLFYTTTCEYCLRTIPAWRQVTEAAAQASLPAQVYGISLDSVDVTRQYAAEHRLPYPTIRFPDEKTASMYRAGTVPLTVVLDEEGRTLYSRIGEISTRAAIDSVVAAMRWRNRPAPSDTAAPATPVASR